MAEGLRSTTVDRDAVLVRGPDAVTYLQGQLSQDVAALEVGGSAWSWLLQPAGKVDALVRVTRTGPEDLLVDVDHGWGEAVLNRLTRFKLRTKAELARRPLQVVALRGPGARQAATAWAAAADLRGVPSGPDAPFEPATVIVSALWPVGEEAADVLVAGAPAVPVAGAAAVPVAGAAAVEAAGPPAVALDGDDWEAERIAAGVPAMGAELTDRTIPAETGLVALTASFTKGCYTGQELVARIDSRGGHVARHLRRLLAGGPLAPGDELTDAGGKVVGAVTSAARSGAGGSVGLAYLARSVAAGDLVRSPGGPVTVLGAPVPVSGDSVPVSGDSVPVSGDSVAVSGAPGRVAGAAASGLGVPVGDG